MTSGVASGNGRFPQAQFAVVGPGRSSVTMVVRTTFGLVASDDSGRSFKYLCEDAFEVMDGYDPAIALNAESTLLVGLPDGLMTARDRCSTQRREELQAQQVRDLAADASGRIVVAALVSRDAVPVSRVARSEDGAGHFTLPTLGMTGMVLDTVELAPSSTQRVYASGYTFEGHRVQILRSDDGGASFRVMSEIPGVSGAFVSAVDAQNPDVLWVRASTPSDAMDSGQYTDADGPSVLMRSDDGGAHLREVARTRGPMRGFALADDGRRVFIGGPDARDGLLRSDDGGGSFARVADAPVECLRWHEGALYVCETYRAHGVLLARSTDDGRTLTSLVNFDGIDGPPRCASSTRVGQVCPLRWPGVRAIIAPEGPLDAAVRDVATSGDTGALPPDGCDCGVPRGPRASPWGALLALGFALRKRRRDGGKEV